MKDQVCKNCGKPPLADRAGSFTSYMFQHKYCSCGLNSSSSTVAAVAPSGLGSVLDDDTDLCLQCGKAVPAEKRVGSFTAFLFKNLRCQCPAPLTASSRAATRLKRNNTAYRTAQRKQFTDSAFESKFSDKSKVPGQRVVLAPGTIIGGTFKIIDVLGEGGMGVVYSAEQTALQRSFALKILSPDLVNEQTWKRFQAEAKMLASLSHSTLVKVYDLGIHEHSLPFYSMDLLPGRTLERILADEGALDLDETIEIFLKVLDGLAYAHRHNIIHRDLKPANIMVSFASGEPQVKILDFGISKLLSAKADQMQNLTMAGEIFGSPFYMSPEQCVGGTVDARSDIYSIGCSLFETLTACVPFEGVNSVETVFMHEQERPPALEDVCDLVFPDSIEYVVAKCLEKRPDSRYQTAKELAIDLERIKAGDAVHFFSRPAPSTEDKIEGLAADGEIASLVPNRSRRALIAVAILTLIVGASAASIFFFHSFFDGFENVADSSKQSAVTEHFSRIVEGGTVLQFDFPTEFAIGKVNNQFKHTSALIAQGRVLFKVKEPVFFFTNDYLIHHPELLKSFRADDLYSFTVTEQVEDKLRLDKVMPYVARLTGLRSFSADNTRFSDNLIGYINELPNLETLSLNNCEITAAGVSKFKNLRKLQGLDYCYNKGTSEILAALAGSDNLHGLAVEAPEKSFTDADIENILSLKNLEHLSLMATGVSGETLLKLAAMPKLSFVNVTGCLISPEMIAKARKVNRSLTIQTYQNK